MFSKFFPDSKNLYLNDRHEEADTYKEDRRKLYDKRILPLLEENDFTVFAEKIDPFLWDYYKNLGLAKIKPANIFYTDSYLNYPSLTKAILADRNLVQRLKKEKFYFLMPYIESYDAGKLTEKIGAFLFRSSEFTDWINNKSNYRKVLKELKLPVISGYQTNSEKAERHFNKLKNQGFKKVVLKKERSISGFSVFVIEKEEDFSQCLKDNFSNQKSFVLEGFIKDIKCSPNFQYFITENNVEFIVATDQLFEKDCISYSGNICPSSLLKKIEILKVIEKMSKKICQYLQSKKCFGLVGIDYIVTKQGKVYSTEVNARLNGSTFPALIAQKLFEEDVDIHWLFKAFHFKPTSFKDLFGRFKYFIKRRGSFGVLPVGVDVLKTMGEGQFMIVAKDRSKLYDLHSKFQNLISGN